MDDSDAASLRAQIAALTAAVQALAKKKAPDATIAELGERYRLRARPAAMYTLAAFLAKFGARRPTELAKADYIAWRDERAHGVTVLRRPRAVGTVNTEHAQALAFFRWCLAAQLVDESPIEGIKKLKGQRPRETEIDVHEQADAFADAPLLVRVFQAVCIETGMRPGCEARRLERTHIDRATSTIFIPRENVKGKTRARTVPMSDYLADLLDRYPPVMGSTFVFANPRTRKPYTAKHLAHICRPYLDRLKAAPGDRRVVTHDNRHGAVSRLARGGLNPMVSMKIIGHETATMHWRYLHVSDDDRARAKTLLDDDRKAPRSAAQIEAKRKREITR